MPHILSRVAFSILAGFLSMHSAWALDLFVAKDGADTTDGRAATWSNDRTSGPFATLERARDEIRNLKKAGALHGQTTVHVRTGVYEQAKTLAFGPEDSGTEGTPIVYRSYANERPVLFGGKSISGFVLFQGQILKADVAAQGLKGCYFRQLYFDGKRQVLARYPNADPSHPVSGGWAYVDGDPQPIYKDIPGEDRHTLVAMESDLRKWDRPEDGEVFVFARYNWWNNILTIRSVDRDKRTITLASDASYAIRPLDRYFVQNLFEELDAPGEWYLDKSTWTLYFWPPRPLAGKPVTAPKLATILQLNPGTTDIAFQGFTIECAAKTAVILNQADRCLIAGNTIRNAGDYSGGGIAVIGGSRNGIVGNDISEIGRSGITLSGGDIKTLKPSGHYADNNYIHHFGIYYKQGAGIEMDGAGNRASHNLIHDGPRFAIRFGGNNQIIEYNHIRHVALETQDVGATYCGGRDWISPRGSILRYNFIHDVIGFARVTQGNNTKWVSPYFSWGIYLDDNSGGVDVIGNIVARCGRALLNGHNARDCVIENNIFVDGGIHQWELNGWTTSAKYWDQHFPTMVKGYESVVSEPAWQTMRGMQLHPKDAPDAQGRVMSGNIISRNIMAWTNPKAHAMGTREFNPERNTVDRNLYWNNGQPVLTGQKQPANGLDSWASWQALGPDRNSIIADPMFRNAKLDDYCLDEKSPAWALGFKPIPTEKIGPYKDPLRATWPIEEAPGARETPTIQPEHL